MILQKYHAPIIFTIFFVDLHQQKPITRPLCGLALPNPAIFGASKMGQPLKQLDRLEAEEAWSEGKRLEQTGTRPTGAD
jgi:hypothetical protein